MSLKDALDILPQDHILDHRAGRYKIYFSFDTYALGIPFGTQGADENFVTFMARMARQFVAEGIKQAN